MRLCKPPVGVPSGTDRAGDAKHRERLDKTSPTKTHSLFSLHRRLAEAGGRCPPYGPDCCSKTAIVDRAPLRRPPRRAQLRCCSAGYGAVSENNLAPRSLSARLGKYFRFNSSLKRCISLLRRGARCRSAPENWSLLRKTSGRQLALRENHLEHPLLRPTVSARAPWEILFE